MKNHLTFLSFLTITLLLSVGIFSCNKNDFENKKTLIKLYKSYKNGTISECKLNEQMVCHAGVNAFDAGTTIYDKDGKQIVFCDYAWGPIDPICNQLTDCEVIYRVKINLGGEPAVNKYGL